MVKLGRIASLPVINIQSGITYFSAGSLGQARLYEKDKSEGLSVGDIATVFLFKDADNHLIATTQLPKVQAGECAYLKVVQTTPYGAFLDWGLEKNVLVPFAEQHLPLQEGRNYLAYVYVNEVDGRIVGSTKVDKYIAYDKPHDFQVGQTVKLIIAQSTEIGFKAIINQTHWGLLKKEEVFQRLSFGQSVTGYIQSLRPDGKINLTLNGGHKVLDENGQKIINHLKGARGFLPLHDKSDPKEIYAVLGMSKAAFKKAIGALFKQKCILIQKDGIKAVSEPHHD